MIQLTTAGAVCPDDVNVLRDEFQRQHSVRLPGVIHPELIQMVSSRLERTNWIPRDHGEIGRESAPEDLGLEHLLNFVVNTPQFLELISGITQCPGIVCFEGRVYRMLSDSEHYDTWHSDTGGDDRLVGMSINLGARPYCGGVFRLRGRPSEELVCELPNTGQGDAILFRISRHLEHRVTSVEGTEPKTAFAGWFKSGPGHFYSMISTRPAARAGEIHV